MGFQPLVLQGQGVETPWSESVAFIYSGTYFPFPLKSSGMGCNFLKQTNPIYPVRQGRTALKQTFFMVN